MKAFVIDLRKCNGCYGCQLACKDETVDNEWLPYSLPQQDTGAFWMKVEQKTVGQIPKVRVEYTPKMCNHCADAPCMAAAPDAVYRRDDGLVIIDPIKAKGNKALVDACPYGAIYWNPELEVPQKCTGCAHLVDKGMLPHCVDLCGVGAMQFGEEEELAEVIAQATPLAAPEHGARVYYLNIPKLFIAGEVWDPETDEIIEGAQITLATADGAELKVESDDFGDFLFRHIDAGDYELKIEAAGYKPVEQSIKLEESLNVGDFALERA